MTEYKFFCSKCNYGTNLKHSMKQHQGTRLHITGERKRKDRKTYKCNLCSYKSTNNNNYLTHWLNNHDTKENRRDKFKYYCDICDFGVFTESLYNKHIGTKKHEMRSNNTV